MLVIQTQRALMFGRQANATKRAVPAPAFRRCLFGYFQRAVQCCCHNCSLFAAAQSERLAQPALQKPLLQAESNHIHQAIELLHTKAATLLRLGREATPP